VIFPNIGYFLDFQSTFSEFQGLNGIFLEFRSLQVAWRVSRQPAKFLDGLFSDGSAI